MILRKLIQKIPGITAGVQSRFIHHPRRACLYVPGDDERKLNKIKSLKNVDCLILDTEDGVAQNRKDVARETILKFLSSTDKSILPSTDWAVRINSVESKLFQDDIKSLKSVLSTIFLPKVESVVDLQKFGETLAENPGNNERKLIFYVESCQSIMNLPEICKAAKDFGERYKFLPVGIVFGSDDFVADLGAGKSDSSQEIMYARQRVVLCAKAFKWQAIDMVNINLNDDDGLRKQSLEGALMGYTGKQVIHPKQIEIVQTAFLPNERKVKWAEGLLKSYEEHQKSGKVTCDVMKRRK
ncbi:hypothetical protein ACFFRR_001488 [Megaselia abdita]